MNPPDKQACLIIGVSRDISCQVAIDLAKHLVSVVKTTSDTSIIPATEFPPDPNSPQFMVNTIAREISEAGGSVFALPVDIKDLIDEESAVSAGATCSSTIGVLV
ncbi:uncharacterized protein Z518_09283 [Rhinocladiella mackenziei CBS 650.93]|uniref:Uncharacterized protein n=1 Tax=Rhinocladiella mackenziei CBS 650.93 TaxID=1442369 RepID=A0A0D2FHW6_9EURO|nr:uncharacterized protein Z518_09283 [Rhinocladiella mackenziei CBS 650.93]KIX01557.1 hypothetical protein Z518_09283 [Rhinocladiella mackenziei CBS 650.93]